MRVLYFSQYYPPEVGATQTRASEMSRYLASAGHDVTVVTEVPNHPSGIIPPEYRGKLWERTRENGVDVLRLWVAASPEKTFRTRMAFYLSYMAAAAAAGSALHGRYDVVVATSPPLFVGAAGLAAASVRNIPFVFEVRDLWPESAVVLGELNNPRAIQAAERLESLLYRRAARVVAVTEGICGKLRERGLPGGKVALIANGANTDHFRFDPGASASVRRKLGLNDSFVAMYAGIHGIAQGLETLLDAAARLQAEERMQFVFVGEGPRKSALVEKAAEMGLRNVRFLPEVASAEMPGYLSAADCSIVPLRDETLFRSALPSKMFEAWSCSRPVVLSVAGEAASVLAEARGGIACPPEDPAAMADAIWRLADNPEEAAEMGRSGRALVEARYSRTAQARLLESLLSEVVAAK
ncbi:MAG TPA: glycosyltransferase family 4 protein [Chloroflexia bacterium]|nr:glycosyltransferase family 4 protein [Chloroflexia bacterium]